MQSGGMAPPDAAEQPAYTLWQLVLYFLRLGTTGFGGPVALAGYMHRDLVERRGWISDGDYKEGMALAQLAPGPMAAQLAIYLGYAHYRILGATLTGVAFVLPSFLVVLALAAGVLAWFWRAPPKWLRQSGVNALAAVQVPAASGLASTLDWSLLTQIGLFFAKAGAFVFGSGLAIVPFLYGGVVTEYQWLNEKQFVDAVAVAMITPGPVVITVGFIGYLVAGLPGACVAALATFLPCYLFTVLPAPYFKKYGKLPAILAFVDGVTAAAVGAITGAVLVLAKRSIVDVPTILLSLGTVALLLKFRKLPEPVIITGAALIGLAVYPVLHH
ncbi:chromate transporter [Cupriavidus sp. L7L]|uniref:chromate transporter n=1 Tax=Cupriavidus sp. L7L TaxID=2546443 RepID=UPI001054E825|nr:chromate transporter [Cupriavidus sp. L7L]TDF64295.1 chromate transporter [Cupriavidus sp. L7L]